LQFDQPRDHHRDRHERERRPAEAQVRLTLLLSVLAGSLLPDPDGSVSSLVE